MYMHYSLAEYGLCLQTVNLLQTEADMETETCTYDTDLDLKLLIMC